MNREVILALGSNLGDRLGNLRRAVELLADDSVAVVRTSSMWETPPVPADQPAFLNAVIAAVTDLEPLGLLGAAKRVERTLGRRPNRHWGPRPIDIDILFMGDLLVDTPNLQIPHPRIAERGFVLVPLSEVVQGPLPVLGRSALELLEAVVSEGIRRVGALRS
jgi:2-amino-4-hydroxy-6-hydroxymethyldihydropteridine diphosphokinase